MDSLEKLGKTCGIDLIGVVKANSMDYQKDYLLNRKLNNMESSFEHDNIEARVNPKLIMDSAESVIVIGLSYAYEAEADGGDCPISKSSHGLDYHDVLRDRLEMLAGEMLKYRNFKYHISIDTGPLLERELARLAGIGYFGKNCNIINPKLGSYIFIGLMLVDFSFDEYSTLIEMDCGNCKLCVSACPTGALSGDYRVNPMRCLSYISQTKGEVPMEYRDKLEYIYGCDICQRVCPKNIGISNNVHSEFKPLLTSVNLDEIRSLSNREFKEKYGKYAFSWRGKNTILRNCEIVSFSRKKVTFLKELESLYML